MIGRPKDTALQVRFLSFSTNFFFKKKTYLMLYEFVSLGY